MRADSLPDSRNIMDLFTCSVADCRQDSLYQCLDDSDCVCSLHLKKSHARHKFKPISREETAYRRALITLIQTDIRFLSMDGLRTEFRNMVQSQVNTAAERYRDSFEEWIEVHRGQLQRISGANTLVGPRPWAYGFTAVVERLGVDYSGPLVDYELEIEPGLIAISTPQASVDPPRPLDSSDDIITRFLTSMKSLTTAAFFQDNRYRLMSDLMKLWDSQSFHHISLKGVNTETDLMALALLVSRSTTTRSLIVTRSGFNKRNCRWLSEALRRTRAEIRTLDVSGNGLGDEGFEEFVGGVKEMKALNLLGIRCIGISDASLSLLKSLPGLRLDAVGNRFSSEAKSTLLSLHPENKV